MKAGQRYLYRTTTDKLTEHMQHIEESGDSIISEHFQGGRDWTLICRKGGGMDPAYARALGRLEGALDQMGRTLNRSMGEDARRRGGVVGGTRRTEATRRQP